MLERGHGEKEAFSIAQGDNDWRWDSCQNLNRRNVSTKSGEPRESLVSLRHSGQVIYQLAGATGSRPVRGGPDSRPQDAAHDAKIRAPFARIHGLCGEQAGRGVCRIVAGIRVDLILFGWGLRTSALVPVESPLFGASFRFAVTY